MSIVVKYPARVDSYRIDFNEKGATIRLSGTEEKVQNSTKPRLIADLHFNDKEGSFKSEPFINRGGFMRVSRPILLLPSILTLLNQKSTVFLDENGNLSTSRVLNAVES